MISLYDFLKDICLHGNDCIDDVYIGLTKDELLLPRPWNGRKMWRGGYLKQTVDSDGFVEIPHFIAYGENNIYVSFQDEGYYGISRYPLFNDKKIKECGFEKIRLLLEQSTEINYE